MLPIRTKGIRTKGIRRKDLRWIPKRIPTIRKNRISPIRHWSKDHRLHPIRRRTKINWIPPLRRRSKDLRRKHWLQQRPRTKGGLHQRLLTKDLRRQHLRG